MPRPRNLCDRAARLPAVLSALRVAPGHSVQQRVMMRQPCPPRLCRHASACHWAFAVRQERTRGRLPQGWRLLLARADAGKAVPPPSFLPSCCFIAAGSRVSLPETAFLDCPWELVLAVSLTWVPPPLGLCPFQSPSPLSLQILGLCLALSRRSKNQFFNLNGFIKWIGPSHSE